MAENKFVNLNARIFQGHDPNTEFKETGNLFSSARFADKTYHQESSLIDQSRSGTANIRNSFSGSFLNNNSPSYNDGSSNTLPFAQDKLNNFQSVQSQYADPQSSSSAGGETPDNFRGLSTVGGAAGAAPITNHFLSLPSGVGGSASSTTNNNTIIIDNNNNPPSTPGDTLDAPVVSFTGTTTNEGSPIPLNIGLTVDAQAGVSTTITILGIPANATLSAGTLNGDGSWTLTPAQLTGLILTPDPHSSGNISISVTATSTFNALTASDSENANFTIQGAASVPTLTATTVSGSEDSAIHLNINSALTDTDGSEALSINISGVPTGATLSAGINNGAGSWTLTQAQLSGLTLTPPHDFSGAISLTATATSSENGSTASTSVPFIVNVTGVADIPSLTVQTATGNESTPVALSIASAITDVDGSETLSINISNLPMGATLSAGILNVDGSWTLTPAQLTGLNLIPAAGFSGNFDLTVLATSTEGNTHAFATSQLSVTINGMATAPTLSTSPASGDEDTPIALTIGAGLVDNDGSENLSITITGVPIGAILSAGTNNGGGSWTLNPAQLSGLTLTPAHDFSGTINLGITATSSENGTTATANGTLAVTVHGVADAPTLSVSAASGTEATPINLTIASALTDTDGSETLSINISDLPNGSVLSAGIHNADGSWTLTQAQLTGLTITTPNHWSGTASLNVTATSSEDGTTATTTSFLPITVTGTIGLPVLSVNPAFGNEDTPITLDISAIILDADGSEVLTYTITGVPTGATLSAGVNNGNGNWTLQAGDVSGLTMTPPHDFSGTINLNVTALSTEGADTAQDSHPLVVSVAGVPDVPTLNVSAASGNEHSPIALTINAALTDTDGSETLSVTITGVPAGATLSAGTNNGGGSWTLTPAQLMGLTITPPANYSGSFNLGVIASASENSQTSSTSSTSLGVTVAGVATAPTLSTSPASGNEDTAIPLTINAALVDNDGSETLSVTITGVPTGATLSAGTNNGGGSWTLTPAQLTGLTITPPANYSGSFNLNVTATSSENSTTATANAALGVTVGGVPDLPSLNVSTASGNEHSPIALNINAALTDTDGSETLSIAITGVPAGAILSAGTNNGGGNWTLTPVQLAGLTITPPANYSGSFNLGVVATTSENSQSISTSSSTLGVTVAGVATAPSLVVQSASGNEDSAISLNIAAALVDNDGSETLSVTITGVPTGAILSAGTNNGGGSWTLTPAQLTGLTITPASNYSGSFTLSVTATSSENATQSSVQSNLGVTVHGVADTPTLSVGNINATEDAVIPLNITSALTDTDGSETLSILVAGVPAGASLSAGLNNGDGSWSLTKAQLSGLTFTPPANWAGVIGLQVSAIATENDGDSVKTTTPITVTIAAQADAPSLTLLAASGKEDTAIALNIAATLNDLDGSENLSVIISGLPVGASLSAGTNNAGVWTLTAAQLTNLKITPPTNSDADFTLNVTAKATDGNGTTATTSSTLAVTVLGNADAPTVSASNTSGAVNTQVPITISGAVTDANETLTYLISGVPDGFSLTTGINNGNNTWTLSPADLANLKLVSPYNFEGRVNMTVQSVSHDNDGSVAQSLSAGFNVGVGDASGGIQINLGLGIGVAGIGVGVGVGIGVNLGGLLDPGGLVVMEDSTYLLGDAGLLTTLVAGITYLTFNGLPTGASLSAGIDLGGGSYKLLAADLTGLKLILPPNSDKDFTITIKAKLAILTVDLLTVPVHVIGVADLPTLNVANATGNEDANSIPISVTSVLTDTDGSETLTFTIKDLPTGFTPTVGIDNGNGTWSLTAAQIASLAIKSPADWSGDATFTIIATSTEREGDSSINTATGHIHVNPVADAPIISAVTNSGTEDNSLTLNLGIALKDTDGSEHLSSVTISGLAAGFSLTGATDNGNGTWSVNPAQLNSVHLVTPPHWSGDLNLNVSATSQESSGGATATTNASIPIHIEASATMPNVNAGNITGVEHHAINMNVSASLNDTDGSEHLSVTISNVPDDFVFSSGLNNGNGSWSFTASQLTNLTMTPDHFTGDVTMHVDAISEDSNHTTAIAHTDFTVHVSPDL